MDMEKLIARINELSRKNKSEGLTADEIKERDELRKKYLINFRSNMRQQLDNIEFVDAEDQGDNKTLLN
ncbi:MAG: DUF896 domain-containing protein [Candidatus Pristimantibacillus lignocellulolyticus]|uniref:UPF0291 protein NAG76_19275 n=1 Tax=Candidatus Pristimantibacillus lignocellulolyticus TaxID=2994561 RepID=A0A9J6ZD29_9BACL|nr:MAG: DUF896 domain-containing protein [Candidatus Pristimantibacillus lignocellulolyticus]